MADGPVKLPRTIDDPPMLMIWSIYELGPVSAGAIVGVIADETLSFTALGLVAALLYRRFRDGRQDGWELHALYWIGGLSKSIAKTFVNPHMTRFFP